MKALYIGRFQPFHKGHLKVIKTIYKDYDQIIIGIGSSQYNNTYDNPFTSSEREQMIKETLNANKIKNYKIILIPDIHNPPKWVDHVLSIYSDFDIVVTNSEFVNFLFTEKGFKVLNTELFEKEKLSGNVIRKKINKNEKWEHLVPKQVVNIIKEKNGENRIRKT